MILIIGGSFQGKLDFAKARFGLDESDIFLCDGDTEALDASRRCLAYIEKWALNRVRAGEEPLAAFPAELRGDAVVIATDIACGVVPVDPVMRAWREGCGRLNAALAERADEVWRLFCGIPQHLK
ncbi:MAG: bifunctional adenosylcobinamide kinase/adenosylcobinamide-phosphate guanylyltransferase [Clostridia bacterium]|nr:bifunctional adenosylcobinamide kinase/adenosylcobinamide-phosphate guanylyltransferase [Clostridia bacterium]